MSDRLRTFCHISEYDAAGYGRLHQIIAASEPLVLWAPSSCFLADPAACSISSRDFLHFVEKGSVQVVAREPWLDSPSFRESHKWAGAEWNGFIDDALRRMYRDDQRVSDPRERRVSAAPKEDGPDWATKAIEEDPRIATKIVEVLNDGDGNGEIPPGTLQTAVRKADDAFGRAKVVLRDAYNHADAFRLTQSDTAILLGPGDGFFSRRVAASYVEMVKADPQQAGEGPGDGLPTITASELSGQLIDLLATLESLGPGVDLRSFMAGKGHEELISWSREVINRLASVPPKSLKEELVAALRSDLEDAEFRSTPLDERLVVGGSLLLSLIGLLEGAETVTLLGLAFAAYPLLKAGAQKSDLIPTEFNGPQWPFRYVWGGSARPGRHEDLLGLL